MLSYSTLTMGVMYPFSPLDSPTGFKIMPLTRPQSMCRIGGFCTCLYVLRQTDSPGAGPACGRSALRTMSGLLSAPITTVEALRLGILSANGSEFLVFWAGVG